MLFWLTYKSNIVSIDVTLYGTFREIFRRTDICKTQVFGRDPKQNVLVKLVSLSQLLCVCILHLNIPYELSFRLIWKINEILIVAWVYALSA